jgi:hypothetical protein
MLSYLEYWEKHRQETGANINRYFTKNYLKVTPKRVQPAVSSAINSIQKVNPKNQQKFVRQSFIAFKTIHACPKYTRQLDTEANTNQSSQLKKKI